MSVNLVLSRLKSRCVLHASRYSRTKCVTVITALTLELNDNLRAASRSPAAQTSMSLRDNDALGSGPASFRSEP